MKLWNSDIIVGTMKDFIIRNKVSIITLLVTFAVIIGGVFLIGGKNSSTQKDGNVVDVSILVPDDVFKTSGFVNGNYIPASPSATVTLVEFGDYVCPACGVYAPYVKQVLSDYSGKITYVFRNFPLSYHTNAPLASYVAEASGIQGKYWEMHEQLYSTQADWSNLDNPMDLFISYAKELNLNIDKFSIDINSDEIKQIIKRDTEDGNKVKLSGTPTFYINGIEMKITGDPKQLSDLIQKELAK